MVESKASLYLKEFILERVEDKKFNTISAIGESTLLEKETLEFNRVCVNFRANLRDMIKETKFLEKMEFTLPETAINIALQVFIQVFS
jgi:dynein heavy chain